MNYGYTFVGDNSTTHYPDKQLATFLRFEAGTTHSISLSVTDCKFEYNLTMSPSYNSLGSILYFDYYKTVSFDGCTFSYNISSYGVILFKSYTE